MLRATLLLRREGADRAKKPCEPFQFVLPADPTRSNGIETIVDLGFCFGLISAQRLAFVRHGAAYRTYVDHRLNADYWTIAEVWLTILDDFRTWLIREAA